MKLPCGDLSPSIPALAGKVLVGGWVLEVLGLPTEWLKVLMVSWYQQTCKCLPGIPEEAAPFLPPAQGWPRV